MTAVEMRETTSTRYEFVVPGAAFGGFGAAVADVEDAIRMARLKYRGVFGSDSTFDDWLRVYAADDEIVFWFDGPST